MKNTSIRKDGNTMRKEDMKKVTDWLDDLFDTADKVLAYNDLKEDITKVIFDNEKAFIDEVNKLFIKYSDKGLDIDDETDALADAIKDYVK